MKVILKTQVPKLGKAGELVEVKNGFGRNYLLPRALAVLATAKGVRELAHQKRVIGQQQAKEAAAAAKLAEKIAAARIQIARKVGEQEKLFGSVTAKDIAEALLAAGVSVDRHLVQLEEPIKALGVYDVPVKLHPEVSAQVKVYVVAEA